MYSSLVSDSAGWRVRWTINPTSCLYILPISHATSTASPPSDERSSGCGRTALYVSKRMKYWARTVGPVSSLLGDMKSFRIRRNIRRLSQSETRIAAVESAAQGLTLGNSRRSAISLSQAWLMARARMRTLHR